MSRLSSHRGSLKSCRLTSLSRVWKGWKRRSLYFKSLSSYLPFRLPFLFLCVLAIQPPKHSMCTTRDDTHYQFFTLSRYNDTAITSPNEGTGNANQTRLRSLPPIPKLSRPDGRAKVKPLVGVPIAGNPKWKHLDRASLTCPLPR